MSPHSHKTKRDSLTRRAWELFLSPIGQGCLAGVAVFAFSFPMLVTPNLSSPHFLLISIFGSWGGVILALYLQNRAGK